MLFFVGAYGRESGFAGGHILCAEVAWFKLQLRESFRDWKLFVDGKKSVLEDRVGEDGDAAYYKVCSCIDFTLLSGCQVL